MDNIYEKIDNQLIGSFIIDVLLPDREGQVGMYIHKKNIGAEV